MNNVTAFKLTQKSRDDARCLTRIRKSAAIEIKAESRRNAREAARSNNPMRHPKWRKARLAEAMRSWWLHGETPEDARLNTLAPVGDLPT